MTLTTGGQVEEAATDAVKAHSCGLPQSVNSLILVLQTEKNILHYLASLHTF
jgi:hypothetical protein